MTSCMRPSRAPDNPPVLIPFPCTVASDRQKPSLLLRGHLRAQALLLLSELGSELGTEVLRLDSWQISISASPLEQPVRPQAPCGSEEETWKIVASGSAASDFSRTASVFPTSGNDS